ncbi:fatty acyl-CoA reductase wat-like [Leguminivora glycinivorella]|uniref:fatty acyl-CoA reductase wat-like n=1 Tax=Leguminivora glycinivorella TaxID=1035111 RepID=UPI00200DE652|nr:fatty acyl-CoA reductase wat-like [Leguminivora glycinivorella]
MTTMDPAVAQEVAAMSRHRAIDDAISRGDSAVQEFYKDAVVFVTGGSGFLGKHLVEKLFRSCDIKRVYLLLREKKGQTSQERVTKIFQDPVYDGLHKRKPGFVDRVTVVNGDITQLRLGISDQDWYTLSNEVNIIFHVAATVTFDEPLRLATRTNVRGTMQALLLGKDCKYIKSFVHVSTAYAHATRSRIGRVVREEFYDSPGDPRTMVDLVEQLSEEKLAAIKPKLIEDWPNTYAYTKALAEEAVRTMSGDLPICIVRPAIVIASNLEPSPGWVDISSVYGPSGLFLGCGLGVIHTIMANDDTHIDLIPVDYVNNATIAAAWATGVRRKNGHQDIKIYTVSPARNPKKWRDIFEISYSKAVYCGTPKAIWYNFDIHTRIRWVFILLTWLLHYIPGYLADGALMLLGKKPKAMKIYRTTYNLSSVLAYFTCHEFFFKDDNLVQLQDSLSKTDKEIYNFDVEKMNWTEQLVMWAIGLRKYIIKDGLRDTNYAVKKQKVLRVLNYLVGALYLYAIYKLCSYVFRFVWMLANF